MKRTLGLYLLGLAILVAGWALLCWGAPLERALPGSALILAGYALAYIVGGEP